MNKKSSFVQFHTVIESIADMMDRLLTPEDGGSSEVGKVVIRRLVPAGLAQLEAAAQTTEKRAT